MLAQESVACTHCGLPLVDGSARTSDGEAYCCSGCLFVHRLSHRGLESSPERLHARVVLSALLAMGVMVFSLSLYGGLLHEAGSGETERALTGILRLGALAFSTPALLLLGLPLADAVLRMRRYFSAEALILAGTSAAWVVSVWNTYRGGGDVYFDTATMVLLLYSVGRWLDVRVRERATLELKRIVPERQSPVARIDSSTAGESSVLAAELRIGDLVRVRPGEVVPVDGVVVSGRSFTDTAALTGESQPRSIAAGDFVHAGVSLVDGSLVVRTCALVGDRLRDEVERLLQEAQANRSRWVRVADRLAGALMPLVVGIAFVTVARRWGTVGPERAWLDGLSVVLISCPCALGIATPLAFWTAIGAAWKRGVLVRGGETLEALARVRRVYLDKTGTLTSGELELVAVHARDIPAEDALRLAAALEVGSEHPIARCVRQAWHARESDRALPEAHDFRVRPGVGVEGFVEGRALALVSDAAVDGDHMCIALMEGPRRLAQLVLHARARPEAARVVRALRAQGLDVAVLTGDAAAPADALARELGVRVESRLSPADKVARVRAGGRGTAFVGDGLNDAAALAAADVGISMAGSSAASLSAAQVNMLRPGLDELPELFRSARAALRAAKFNLGWAFLYNGIGLYLACTGRLTPIFAASAMVASSLVSVLNSSRLARRARDGTLRTSAESDSELRPTAALHGTV